MALHSEISASLPHLCRAIAGRMRNRPRRYTLILNNDTLVTWIADSAPSTRKRRRTTSIRYTRDVLFPGMVDAGTLSRYEKFSSELPGKSHPYIRRSHRRAPFSPSLQNCHRVIFPSAHLSIISPGIFFGASNRGFRRKDFLPGHGKARP